MSEQARAADMAAKLQQFDASTGSSLASVYVPAAMQDLICRSLEKPTAHLVVIHDQQSSTIPWEAFYFKDRCPALDVGVSRLYRIANRIAGLAGRYSPTTPRCGCWWSRTRPAILPVRKTRANSWRSSTRPTAERSRR